MKLFFLSFSLQSLFQGFICILIIRRHVKARQEVIAICFVTYHTRPFFLCIASKKMYTRGTIFHVHINAYTNWDTLARAHDKKTTATTSVQRVHFCIHSVPLPTSYGESAKKLARKRAHSVAFRKVNMRVKKKMESKKRIMQRVSKTLSCISRCSRVAGTSVFHHDITQTYTLFL